MWDAPTSLEANSLSSPSSHQELEVLYRSLGSSSSHHTIRILIWGRLEFHSMKVKSSGFCSCHWHRLAFCLWTNYLTSLCLILHLYKGNITTLSDCTQGFHSWCAGTWDWVFLAIRVHWGRSSDLDVFMAPPPQPTQDHKSQSRPNRYSVPSYCWCAVSTCFFCGAVTVSVND